MSLMDNVETMILMALDASHCATQGVTSSISDRAAASGKIAKLSVDTSYLLPMSVMEPRSAYTFSSIDIKPGDDQRLIAFGPEYLLQHPAELLQEEEECIMMFDGQLKWMGCRKLKGPPKNVATLGKPSHWYELHFRHLNANGTGNYGRRIIPFAKDGNVLPAAVRNVPICTPHVDGAALIMMASIKEDAHRANTMLAEVKDATEIKFPVPIDDYKATFSDRDGPYSGSRRKAIIHWVAKHLRRLHGASCEVKKHTRGVQEFSVDGIRVRITPNTGALNG